MAQKRGNKNDKTLDYWSISVCSECSEVRAETPATLTYQGQLGDSVEQPLNGAFTMRFALYDVASGGIELWFESQSVTVGGGNFSVQLDAGIFDVGASRIPMPDFVSIAGAGRDVTQILSSSSTAALDMGNNSTKLDGLVLQDVDTQALRSGRFAAALELRG